eukprot:436690_1
MGQPIYCKNASQCVGNQLILVVFGDPGDGIYGSGYKSISGMNTSITAENSRRIFCSGAFACTETSFIIGGGISCYGAGSCANIIHPSKIHGETYVRCHGANACQNSNIISNDTVFCYGDQSCSHSNITSPTVY